MNMTREIIKCPHCGFEYLPAEIFYAEDIIGNPKDIVRDEKGCIEYSNGEESTKEEYCTCDKCGCTFKITCEIKYKTEVVEDEDFSTDYETKLD